MDSPATQVAAAVEQMLPSPDIVETSASAMGLIAQTPAAVIVENADAPLAAVAEVAQA
jgi:hypothetical protein